MWQKRGRGDLRIMQSKGRHETKLWFQLFTFMNFDVLGGEGGFPLTVDWYPCICLVGERWGIWVQSLSHEHKLNNQTSVWRLLPSHNSVSPTVNKCQYWVNFKKPKFRPSTDCCWKCIYLNQVKCVEISSTFCFYWTQFKFVSCRFQAGSDFETTSCREKTSASLCWSAKDSSGYGQSPSFPHERHYKATSSVTGKSSVSQTDSISTCKDSGFCGSVLKKKDKHGSLIITYYLWGEPIPYRTSLPEKSVTLGQFKTLLPPRKGIYR